MQSFGHAARRSQFAAGRTAVRTLAGERLGLDPVAVPLAVGDDGAPEIAGMHVSIAHTGRQARVAALAAVADGPVGVDIERVAPRRADLWRRILRPDEHSLLNRLGGPTDSVQTLLWTLKESVLKAQRTGFRAGGTSVRLTLDGDPALERGTGRAVADSGEWALSFGREDDLWLAVAYRKQT